MDSDGKDPITQPGDVYSEAEETQVRSDVDIVLGGGDDNGGGGNRPRLKLSSAILLQLAGVVVATIAAMASVQVRVDHLTQDQQVSADTNMQILRRVTELQAKVDFLTEELRYIRAKTDRIAEKEK